MGRRGKVGSKPDVTKRGRSKDRGSDDSDEDYVVSDEGNDASDDELADYCSSDDGYASEESFGSLVEEQEEEEEEEEELEVRKVVGSKTRKSNLGNGKNGSKTSRKRKRVLYGDEEDEDYEGEEEEDEDEEFTPDEDDCLDDDEDIVVTRRKNGNKKNKKVGRKGLSKKCSVRGRKRSKSVPSMNPSANKQKRTRGLRRKERCDDDEDADFLDDILVARERSKKNSGRRKRKYIAASDSDFVSSGSSDYEYTISEEEREQVREANELFGDLKTSLRSSSSSKKIQEDGNLWQLRKPLARKGEEKIEEVKTEVGKQVCGICLSEEDKRRLRGTLDCCSHYFCFTCIMEWSKVESRCPLCKQRFKTITKPERSAAGVDLRSLMIQVPERDQVYQPSEEDLRSYFDPYENVICSECHQGGDDGLMLLCDLCDSSAHTYCVGLGQVVPDGNWYCDGCRPVALGSSGSQAHDHLPDQRNTPIVNFGEGLDPSSVSSPRLTVTQGPGNLPSPRITVGEVQAASPGSGAGAPTLSGRRWRHRQIQNLRFFSRMNSMAGSADCMPTANLSGDFLNSQIEQGRETMVQHVIAQEATGPFHQAIFDQRLHDYPSSSLVNGDHFAQRISPLGRQVLDPNITIPNGSVNSTVWPGHAGINRTSYEQLRQCSGISNIGSVGVSNFTAREECDFYVAKEQLQSIVKSHLNNLSRDLGLDDPAVKDIARSSTHTILAACGLEHRRSEVQVVYPHPPTNCSHIDRVAAGQTSLMKGFCSSCFDSFVKDVVKRIMDTRRPQWLSLGL